MFKVYILYSGLKDRFYVGFTADSIEERIRRHNTNHKGFTGHAGDWILKHLEHFSAKELALKREKEIKAWKSRKKIIALIHSTGLEHSDF